MNKILLASTVVLAMGASFAGGYYIGNNRGHIASFGISARINALQNRNVLEKLEANKIEKAKDLLNLMLDNNILEINGFRIGNDEEEKKIIEVLVEIAKYRQKHSYTNISGNGSDKKVKEILKYAPDNQPDEA